MKLLLTVGIILTLGTSFGQDDTYTLTINLTDSLSGNPTPINTAFGIKQYAPGTIKMKGESSGIYNLELKPGKYAFQFKSMYHVTKSFTIELNSDTTKTLLFPDPK